MIKISQLLSFCEKWRSENLELFSSLERRRRKFCTDFKKQIGKGFALSLAVLIYGLTNLPGNNIALEVFEKMSHELAVPDWKLVGFAICFCTVGVVFYGAVFPDLIRKYIFLPATTLIYELFAVSLGAFPLIVINAAIQSKTAFGKSDILALTFIAGYLLFATITVYVFWFLIHFLDDKFLGKFSTAAKIVISSISLLILLSGYLPASR
ncbi:hypothetical protein [Undibacterium sp. Di24W]|uniref:hypothetical protein n=1 Tax=Undibacterium sp. Di24W TaxID=3413033 RepID=UPI003BF362D7